MADASEMAAKCKREDFRTRRKKEILQNIKGAVPKKALHTKLVGGFQIFECMERESKVGA